MKELKSSSIMNPLESDLRTRFPLFEKLPFIHKKKEKTYEYKAPIFFTPIYKNPQINRAFERLNTPRNEKGFENYRNTSSKLNDLSKEIEHVQKKINDLDIFREQKEKIRSTEVSREKYLSEYERKFLKELEDATLSFKSKELPNKYEKKVGFSQNNIFTDNRKIWQDLDDQNKPLKKVEALPLLIKFENIKRNQQQDCIEKEIFESQKKSFQNLSNISNQNNLTLAEALKKRTFAKFDLQRKRKIENLYFS